MAFVRPGPPRPLLPILSLLVAGGCATVLSHRDLGPGTMDGPPRGLYRLTIHSPAVGSMTSTIAAESAGGRFRANSRPGAAGELAGGFAGLLLPIVGGPTMAGGAFLHWSGPVPDPASPGVTATDLLSPLGALRLDLTALDEPMELHGPGDELIGYATLAPAQKDHRHTQYARLAEAIDAALASGLFDPALYRSPATARFRRCLRRVAKVARDDSEFALGFFLASGRLPFSHVYLWRRLDPPFRSRLSRDPNHAGEGEIVSLTEEGGIAVLRIRRFDEVTAAVDAAFAEIAQRRPRGLIIDLRGNPGGDASSLEVAAHLLATPRRVGVLFRPEARAAVLAGDLARFPRLSRAIPRAELNRDLDASGAVVGCVEPVAPRYDGPVALLVDDHSASACEPLAELLARTERATLVGRRTAGAMLMSRNFDVGQGWRLALPVADYLAAGGVRLEGRGVEPDVKTTSAEALSVARALLTRPPSARATGRPGR